MPYLSQSRPHVKASGSSQATPAAGYNERSNDASIRGRGYSQDSQGTYSESSSYDRYQEFYDVPRVWERQNPEVTRAAHNPETAHNRALDYYPISSQSHTIAGSYHYPLSQPSYARPQHNSSSSPSTDISYSSAQHHGTTSLSASNLQTFQFRHQSTTGLSEWERSHQREGPYNNIGSVPLSRYEEWQGGDRRRD